MTVDAEETQKVVTMLQLKGFDARWRHVSWFCLHVFLHGFCDCMFFCTEVHPPSPGSGQGAMVPPPVPPPPAAVTPLKTQCTFFLICHI